MIVVINEKKIFILIIKFGVKTEEISWYLLHEDKHQSVII